MRLESTPRSLLAANVTLLAKQLTAVTLLGHQGTGMDSSTLLVPGDIPEGLSMDVLTQALLCWSVGWDLSLSLTPRLVIFGKALQCRDVLWTSGL